MVALPRRAAAQGQKTKSPRVRLWRTGLEQITHAERLLYANRLDWEAGYCRPGLAINADPLLRPFVEKLVERHFTDDMKKRHGFDRPSAQWRSYPNGMEHFTDITEHPDYPIGHSNRAVGDQFADVLFAAVDGRDVLEIGGADGVQTDRILAGVAARMGRRPKARSWTALEISADGLVRQKSALARYIHNSDHFFAVSGDAYNADTFNHRFLKALGERSAGSFTVLSIGGMFLNNLQSVAAPGGKMGRNTALLRSVYSLGRRGSTVRLLADFDCTRDEATLRRGYGSGAVAAYVEMMFYHQVHRKLHWSAPQPGSLDLEVRIGPDGPDVYLKSIGRREFTRDPMLTRSCSVVKTFEDGELIHAVTSAKTDEVSLRKWFDKTGNEVVRRMQPALPGNLAGAVNPMFLLEHRC